MAYAEGNPKTKRLLREWVQSGKQVRIFSPGPFRIPDNYSGQEYVEGPHFPKAHMWYAVVQVENGRITGVK